MLRPRWIVVASMLFPVLLAGPVLADPLAILAAAEGAVEVVSGRGASQHATFGRPLERGDVVKVGAAGAATVVFNDGHVTRLAAGRSLTIEAGAEASGDDASASVPGEVFAQVSKYVTAGSRQKGLVALSALRSGKGTDALPLIVAPRMTDLLDDRPSFRWRAVEGAQRYRVTLSGDDGDLWTKEVSTAELAYPADAAALPGPGDYVWRLEAWSDRGPLRDEESAFHVLEPARRDEVRGQIERIAAGAGGADSPATHFLAGSFLYASGLFGDAAAHFEALGRLAPESPAPHEALGHAYRAMGLMALAAAEFETALALSR